MRRPSGGAYEGFGGWGGKGQTGIVTYGRYGDPVDPDAASELFNELAGMPSPIKKAVELATDRLRRSRTHPNPADTALDLGIASEIILLHGPRSTGETTLRLTLRGAYLLGPSAIERRDLLKRFRALYAARSAAAHDGLLGEKHGEGLQDFDRLCRSLIREILKRKTFPDWDELVVGLGG